MIYDPITRQQVEIIGRYPVQTECFRFGEKLTGEFRFAKVRYGEYIPGASGGFAIGEERDVDITNLVADAGWTEIRNAYGAAPELEAATA